MARGGREAGRVLFTGSQHFHWLELVVKVHLDMQSCCVFTAVNEVNGNCSLNMLSILKKCFSCISRYPKVVSTFDLNLFFFFNGAKDDLSFHFSVEK